MKQKPWLLILLTPIFFHLLSLFFHFGEVFKPRHFEHGFRKEFATKVAKQDGKNLDAILLQPYHFLGNGKQMVAFISDDGKYVLKLFNPMRPLKQKWFYHLKYWKRYSSLKWISREWFQKKKRLKKLFVRHQLAYEYLKEETGLIYVHLHEDPTINHFIQLTDNRGKTHTLELRKTPFVLQEKATLVPAYLCSISQEEGKKAIERIRILFAKRAKLGITDRIQTMENNYGFVGDKPIQIDVGRIRLAPNLEREKDQARILANFEDWLQNHFPEIR